MLPWRPFAADTFAEARASARPILLVIGAASSHATHQLDDEALEDPAILAQLAGLSAIRVDADERPDVDVRYQRLAPAWPELGWPLCVLLTPDGETRALLRHPSRRRLHDFLRGAAGDPPRPSAVRPVEGDPIAALVASLRAAYTPAFGGFGPAPRPPHAPALALLLEERDPELRAMALATLEAMAAGGLHDQLAGGFHRESADDRWVVPRFEKRAVDQGALLPLYARAFALTGRAQFAEVARGITRFVSARLADPQGGIACAEDADTGPWDDGSGYTFSLAEAQAALAPDELAVAVRAFDLYGRGELTSDPTRNVLFVAASPVEIGRELGRPTAEVEALLDRARTRLLAAREARPRPPVHPALYVAESALYARALLDVDPALAHEGARDHALRTIDRLAREALSVAGVRHRIGDGGENVLTGWLEDHAALGLGALAAFRATGNSSYHALASELAARLLADHLSEEGGFFDRPSGASGPGALAQPLRPIFDRAQMSGNALAGRLLLELARLDSDEKKLATLDALTAALAPLAAALGPSGAGLIHLARERSGKP